MTETASNQFYSFLIFIGIGILIALIFDIFRILRKSFETSDAITLIQDIAFGLIAGCILLYSVFKFNKRRTTIIYFYSYFIGRDNLYINGK